MKYVYLTIIVLSVLVTSSSYAQVASTTNPSANQAKITILTETSWSGAIATSSGTVSINGNGMKFYSFTCYEGDYYSIAIQKETSEGMITVNIDELGHHLNSGSTSSPYGIVSLTGSCYVANMSGNDNGQISINTDKSDYNYGDTIEVSGNNFADVNDVKYEKLSIKVFDPQGSLISEKPQTTSYSQNSYSDSIQIRGTMWQTTGTYRITAEQSFSYPSQAQGSSVSKSINITYKPSTYVQTEPTIPNPNIQSKNTNTPEQPVIQTPAKIPGWIKTLFKLYGQGQISDDDLLNAIKFLIQQGIIQLNK